MIKITDSIYINESEVKESFIRSSGPGGQHVNKVATAVQLRFNAKISGNISAKVYKRLRAIAGSKLTEDGNLIIVSREHRSQSQNRRVALDKLISLLQQAAKKPKHRTPTRPSQASVEKRLRNKRLQSEKKKSRRNIDPSAD
jgi:ribosome-associated protein